MNHNEVSLHIGSDVTQCVGTDSLSSAIEAEMRTSCPSRYSVVMRSLHWTSSPSGPPLKAFSAILKPDSLVNRPKCTRIWEKSCRNKWLHVVLHYRNFSVLKRHMMSEPHTEPCKYLRLLCSHIFLCPRVFHLSLESLSLIHFKHIEGK